MWFVCLFVCCCCCRRRFLLLLQIVKHSLPKRKRSKCASEAMASGEAKATRRAAEQMARRHGAVLTGKMGRLRAMHSEHRLGDSVANLPQYIGERVPD